MFTVLGASGFIGSALTSLLRANGEEIFIPPRDYIPERGRRLGNLIYCIGLTSDFRMRPFDTVDAHVCLLTRYLTNCDYDSFVYLSSTRVYAGASDTAEDAMLQVQPGNPDHLYNLTKMTGEAACHALAGQKARIVRLSNVAGPNPLSTNFLQTLLKDAINNGALHIDTSPESEKDYIGLDDAVRLIYRVSLGGHWNVYNIAYGTNLDNQSLANAIAGHTGCQVYWKPGAPTIRFPIIKTERIRTEFGACASSIEELLPELIKWYKESKGNGNRN